MLRRCPPRAPRPPARAARATFLAEEALPMARRGYRRAWPGRQQRRPQLLEQRLVALGDGGGRRPGLDEAAARPRPSASPRSGSSSERAAGPRPGRRGRRGARRPRRRPRRPCGPPRCRGRRWPPAAGPRPGSSRASTARWTGPTRSGAAPGGRRRRPAPRPAAPGAAGRRRPRWAGPAASASRSGRAEPAAVDDEDDVGPAGQPPGRLQHQADRLGVADVAGVHDHPALTQARTRPVVVVALARADPAGVDEVGDDPDALALRRARAWPAGCRPGRRTAR